MSETNKQILLASRPTAWVEESNFKLVEAPIPSIADGQLLVRNHFLSLDPYMRGRMNEARGYADPQPLGEVMLGGTVSRVVESRHPGFAPGDFVLGRNGWQEYGVANGGALTKVDPGLGPISYALGVLGMPGMTAYVALLDIGQPRQGETVVVSAAAGAVGSVVGQIAKIKGCRAVGIAGSDEKCAWLVDDLGFDGAVNYKTESVRARLGELCPGGIDVHFENVGGDLLDIALSMINLRARIVLCGLIAQYNERLPPPGPRMLGNLLVKRARMEGFIVLDYVSRFAEANQALAGWWAEGRLTYRTDVVRGLEHAPEALNRLFDGTHRGKLIVEVSDTP